MGYYLHTFICRQDDASLLTNRFDKAIRVDLDQELSLVLMTEELYEQINNFELSNSVDKFEYLTENIETKVLQVIDQSKMAYVEAEYFSGEGGQTAIIWNNNRREKLLEFGQDKINEVLKGFGVIATKGQDEFSTLGFGLRRHTREWLDNSDQ